MIEIILISILLLTSMSVYSIVLVLKVLSELKNAEITLEEEDV